MSKQKIIGIAASLMLALAFISLNQIPTFAIEWDDGWTATNPYQADEEPYKGSADTLQGTMSKADFDSAKSLLQTIQGVEITAQPVDQTVLWPGSAGFVVEVSNPEGKTLHYQWSVSDGASVFDIPGATTDTFIIPSTHYSQGPYWFCCKITDDDGNVLFTDDAELNIIGSVDPGENRPVLYIGDYAIEPGQSIDLAETGYGSGVIIFDNNSTDITFNNVTMLNPDPVMDWALSMTQGILLINTGYKVPDPEFYDESVYANMPTEYHLHFTGDNHIASDFYDEVGAGTIFQAFFSDSDNPIKPTVYLEGDGNLVLDGGSYNYISDGHLSIGINVVTSSNQQTYFGDAFGIQAINIDIEEGVRLDLATNNAAIRAYNTNDANGSLRIKNGALINAHVTPGVGGNVYTGSDFITAEDVIDIDGATLEFTGEVIPERFTPVTAHRLHHFVGVSAGEAIHFNNATMHLEVDAPAHPDGDFAANIMGIKSGVSLPGDDPTVLTIDNSTISINIDAPESVIVSGLDIGGNAEITNSNILAVVTGLGRVSGIIANDHLAITDSNVLGSANGEPYHDADYDEIQDEVYGIIGTPVTINMTNKDHAVYAESNRGAAIAGVNTDAPLHPGDNYPAFTPDYAPTLLNLENEATIITPEDGVISGYTYNHNWGHLDHPGETVYSLADTSSPAREVLITAQSEDESSEDEEDAMVVPDTSAPTTPDTGHIIESIAATANTSILFLCITIGVLTSTGVFAVAYRHFHR